MITDNKFNYIHPEKLFIDTISIVYNPPEADQQSIINAIKKIGWLQTWADKKKKYGKAESTSSYIFKTQYLYAVDVRFPDATFEQENLCRLELKPANQNNAFMRIEYSAAKIDFCGLSTCLDLIIPGGANALFKNGIVTRLDIAMDIEDVKPYQIIIDYEKMRFRKCYLESGRPDSIYIGKDSGERQLYMYDKVKEMKAKKVNNKVLVDYVFPENMTRIELRYRPKGGKSFAALLKLKNPFINSMYIIGTPTNIKKDNTFNLFRDLCVLKGFRHVYDKLTSQEHAMFSQKIMKFGVPDFLNLNALWAGFPTALQMVYPNLSTHQLPA